MIRRFWKWLTQDDDPALRWARLVLPGRLMRLSDAEGNWLMFIVANGDETECKATHGAEIKLLIDGAPEVFMLPYGRCASCGSQL